MSSLEPGQKVHLFTGAPWRDALDLYIGSDAEADRAHLSSQWAYPDRAAENNRVILVLPARNRVVLCVEWLSENRDVDAPDGDTWSTEGSERAFPEGGERAFPEGVSVTALELRMGEPVPEAPATLDDDYAERLLDAIDDEHYAPTPWYRVDASGCADRPVDADEVDDHDRPYTCLTCELTLNSLPMWGCGLVTQTHVVDVHDLEEGDALQPGQLVRLCPTCHALLHAPFGPTLATLASAWRPACPAEHCGARTTLELVWGLTLSPLPPGTIAMGCMVMLDNPVPRYRCGDCGHQWAEED